MNYFILLYQLNIVFFLNIICHYLYCSFINFYNFKLYYFAYSCFASY